jgi:hypothetical protein
MLTISVTIPGMQSHLGNKKRIAANRRNLFRFNNAGNQGGAVYLSSSTMFVYDSDITNNTSDGVGGAVSVDSFGSGFHSKNWYECNHNKSN